jgi:selenocysteine lyase
MLIFCADADFVAVRQTTGQLNPDDLLENVKPNTCLISVMLANNETGIIMPIAEISKFV